MRPLKIIYMGTPLFAVPCLERLVSDGHHVVAVVTQPDRPKGRGNKLAFSPVKEAALAHQLSVFQPESIKDPLFFQQVVDLAPDLIVVVAFGLTAFISSLLGMGNIFDLQSFFNKTQ